MAKPSAVSRSIPPGAARSIVLDITRTITPMSVMRLGTCRFTAAPSSRLLDVCLRIGSPSGRKPLGSRGSVVTKETAGDPVDG